MLRHPCAPPTRQDNNTIYYEVVPDADVLDPLPAPVMMMKLMPSVDKCNLTRVLSFKGSKKDGASGSKKVGNEAEIDPSGKTDEELARELHEKLNT